MEANQLILLLNRLRKEPDETEWLEFKDSYYHAKVLGEYLSALANSACIHGKPRGYLIFGVNDGQHDVVGTTFQPRREKGEGNQDLLFWLSHGLRPNTGFECYEFPYGGHPVVLFEVVPALDRPVQFYGKAWIRVGANKTLLANYPEKERTIWQRRMDWSSLVCERASEIDLDPVAILKARQEFRGKFQAKAAELDSWDNTTFFNKVGIGIHGALTNSAVLLLGRQESAALISPAIGRMLPPV